MKELLIVMNLLTNLMFPNTNPANDAILINNRDVFNYELLNLELKGDILHLDGWAFLSKNQNLHNASTHTITLEIESKGKRRSIPTKSTNRSLTKDMAYQGTRFCSDRDINTDKCNYTYNNVGYSATIDLKTLDTDASYEIFIVIKTHQTKKHYRTPLYFAQERKIETVVNGSKVFLNSDFETMVFDVISPALKVTSTPQHSSDGNQMRQGASCSSTFGNLLYYKNGTRFTNPKSKSLYNNLISYYEVGIVLENCFDSRRRVIEGKGSLTSYIPATFINYKGKPLTITLASIPKPQISAQNTEVEQYSVFDPKHYASAYDPKDGNITNNIKVSKNTVNTRYPGTYQSCYLVTNSSGLSDSKCINVKVIPVKTKIRYINKESFPHAQLELWSIKEYKDYLLTIFGF
ncbi:MAG TPA: immunoglobulin-like domain-containing protein [Erysipelothrix sp.]|nr:immunoglobulin-like domain-containing protein [Erysipelothrix sp.]